MNITKKLMFATIVTGSLFAGGAALQAQDAPPTTTPPAAAKTRPSFNLDALTKQLDLTDAQKPKVKEVIDDLTKKLRELHQDTSIAPADKRAKAKAIRDEVTTKLKDILTPEQLVKWQSFGPGTRRPGGQPPASGAKSATPPQQ